MRKMTVLGLVLVLVLGVSGAALADGDWLYQSDPINVTLKVAEYATVTASNVRAREGYTNWTPGEGNSATLTLDSPGNPNGNAIGWDITVESNAPYILRAQETVSTAIVDQLAKNGMQRWEAKRLVWAFDEAGSNFIIAPNVEWFENDWSRNDGQVRTKESEGIMVTIANNDRGRRTRILQFNAQFFEVSSNGRYSFSQLPAGVEFVGEVIVTVEAPEEGE